MNNICIRLWVSAMIYVPGLCFAQGLPGGLNKPVEIGTAINNLLYTIGGIAVTIAFMTLGIGMGFYQKKWTDIAPVVIGGIIIGGAAAFAGWLIPAR